MDAQTRYEQITQWIRTSIADAISRGQGLPEINAFFQQELASTKTALLAQGLNELSAKNRALGVEMVMNRELSAKFPNAMINQALYPESMLPSLISGTPLGAPQTIPGTNMNSQMVQTQIPRTTDIPDSVKWISFAKFILVNRPHWFPFGQIYLVPNEDPHPKETFLNQKFREFLTSIGANVIENSNNELHHFNELLFTGPAGTTIEQAVRYERPIMLVTYERLREIFQVSGL